MTEEELLDAEEDRAKQGIKAGLTCLSHDLTYAFSPKVHARRHPALAIGLGALAGVLLGSRARVSSVVARAVLLALGAKAARSARAVSGMAGGTMAARLAALFVK